MKNRRDPPAANGFMLICDFVVVCVCVCVSVRVSLARARSVPTGLGCLPCLPAPHTSTVLHQARATLLIGPPSAAVLDHFEDRRVATPEHARPRPWGTSASGTLRMRLTRWLRRAGRADRQAAPAGGSAAGRRAKQGAAFVPFIHTKGPGVVQCILPTVFHQSRGQVTRKTWFRLNRFCRYFIIHFWMQKRSTFMCIL